MRLKYTYLTFSLLLGLSQLMAQNVSTLVNDPNMNFEAIHWHEDGRIYVCDFNNGRLYQLFLDGTIETLQTGIANTTGGGFGVDGSFYYSALSAGTIHRYHPDSNSVATIATGLQQPTGILQSMSPDTLFVNQYQNNSAIKVAISSGEKIPFISQNGLNGPDAIIHDGNGNLIVANFNDHVIYRVNLDGTSTLFATLPFAGFTGYITKMGDQFYVPSIAGRKVYKIDSDGIVELLAGSGTEGNADGIGAAASFSSPNGIVGSPSGDTLLVTDGSRIRIITNLNGTTSAYQLDVIQNLKISPNPAKNFVGVSFELTNARRLGWRVFNQEGKLIQQDSIKNFSVGLHQIQIDIQHLPKGAYTLYLEDQNKNSMKQLFLKVD